MKNQEDCRTEAVGQYPVGLSDKERKNLEEEIFEEIVAENFPKIIRGQ